MHDLEALKQKLAQTRIQHVLHPKTMWRHRRTGGIYQLGSVSYHSDEDEMMVEYVSTDLGYQISFCHRVERFLSSFERVELVQKWELAQ